MERIYDVMESASFLSVGRTGRKGVRRYGSKEFISLSMESSAQYPRYANIEDPKGSGGNYGALGTVR